jgi:transcriptional regulator with XRE-family HTH domain
MNKRNEEAKRRIAQRAVLFAAVRRADPKNQVRSAMLTHGVSMSDLSDITGVNKKKLKKWLNSDEYDLRVSELYLLADALNLSLLVTLNQIE